MFQPFNLVSLSYIKFQAGGTGTGTAPLMLPLGFGLCAFLSAACCRYLGFCEGLSLQQAQPWSRGGGLGSGGAGAAPR